MDMLYKLPPRDWMELGTIEQPTRTAANATIPPA
jgi:hypothetical protein